MIDFENDPNYTNIIKRDLETIKPKNLQIHKVSSIIMFGKEKDKWFCVYDGKYIREYRNECVKKDKYIPMIRHLEKLFNPDLVKNIFEIYDARGFMFCDIISQAKFAASMKQLKNK